MAEGNGIRRLDRVGALLEKMGERLDRVATMGYLHDERLSRVEANFETMQAVMQANWKEMQEREKRLDKRIGTLVSAIGNMIAAH